MPRRSAKKEPVVVEEVKAEQEPAPRRSGRAAKGESEAERSRRSSTVAQTAVSAAESRVTRSRNPRQDSTSPPDTQRSATKDSGAENPVSRIRSARRSTGRINYKESDGEDDVVVQSPKQEEQHSESNEEFNESDSEEEVKQKAKKPPAAKSPSKGRGAKPKAKASKSSATGKGRGRATRKKIEVEEIISDDSVDTAEKVSTPKRSKADSSPEIIEESRSVGRKRGRKPSVKEVAAPEKPSRRSSRGASVKTEENVSKRPSRNKQVKRYTEVDDDFSDGKSEVEDVVEESFETDVKKVGRKRKRESEPQSTGKRSKREKGEKGDKEAKQADSIEEVKIDDKDDESRDSDEPMEIDESDPVDQKKQEGGKAESDEKKDEKKEKVESIAAESDDKDRLSDKVQYDDEEEEEDEKKADVKEVDNEENVSEHDDDVDKDDELSSKETDVKMDSEPADEGKEKSEQLPNDTGSKAAETKEPATVTHENSKDDNTFQPQGQKQESSLNGENYDEEEEEEEEEEDEEDDDVEPEAPQAIKESPKAPVSQEQNSTPSKENGAKDNEISHRTMTNEVGQKGKCYVFNPSLSEDMRSSLKEKAFGCASFNLTSAEEIDENFIYNLHKLQAGIVCFQDVTKEAYMEDLLPNLENMGFKAEVTWLPEQGGLATFYKKSLFKDTVSLRNLHLANLITRKLDASNLEETEKEEIKRCFEESGVMNEDSGYVFLTELESVHGQKLTVANMKIPPCGASLHALQVLCMIKEIIPPNGQHLLICGEFNLIENKVSYQLARCGYPTVEVVEQFSNGDDTSESEKAALVKFFRVMYQPPCISLDSCHAAVLGRELQMPESEDDDLCPNLLLVSPGLQIVGLLDISPESSGKMTDHHFSLVADIAFST